MNGCFNENMTGTDSFAPGGEQVQICEAVKYDGGNHAIFGEAGTGKTSLIRLLVGELRRMGRNVVCVAPTGIAAMNLGVEGAMTIHRAFQLPDDMVENASVHPNASWLCSLDVLLIDEISMVRSDVFATVDRLLKQARCSQQPFGGVQVIVVGDFMQMPPFTTSRELDEYILGKYGSLYSFNTKAWAAAMFTVHKLTSGYRQAADQRFQQYLHGIHSSSLANCELARLNDNLIANGMPDMETPECQLTWLKEDALQINRQQLDKIPGEPLVFTAAIEGNFPPNEFPVDSTLQLKPGEKVLLASNGYDNGSLLYANGDFGTFLQACGDRLLVRLERNGEEVAVTRQTWTHYDYQVTADNQCCSICTGRFTQFPVLHGYAVTINRSQGMTLSGSLNIELPFGKRLPSGVIYTALSRAQSLGQLSCNRMIEKRDLLPPQEIGEFMEHNQLW